MATPIATTIVRSRVGTLCGAAGGGRGVGSCAEVGDECGCLCGIGEVRVWQFALKQFDMTHFAASFSKSQTLAE